MSNQATIQHRPLYEIAREIRQDWKTVNYAAAPYLRAMMELKTVDSMYGFDDGGMVVAYFLSNATTWRGEKAREIKKELKEMLK